MYVRPIEAQTQVHFKILYVFVMGCLLLFIDVV